MNQLSLGIVCPDCEEGPDRCHCNNGVKIPKVKTNIKITIPDIKLKHDTGYNLVVESVQESFPFMNVHQ